MILHLVSLGGLVLVYLFQSAIITLSTGRSPLDGEFILPTVSTVVSIVIIFGVHLGLTIGFRKALEGGHERLKPLSIVTFVFMPVPGILGMISHFLDAHYLANHQLRIMAWMIMQNFTSLILNLRWAALMILLIAASMAFYSCYIRTLRGDGQQADAFSGDGVDN
jgi:hypothetical protein